MSLHRSRRLTRGVAGAAAALLGVVGLSSCESNQPHPGSAAVVNGTSIPTGKVDNTVKAACAYIAFNNLVSTQPQPVALTDLRSNIAGAYVSYQIIAEAAAKLHLVIYPADIAKAASQTTVPPSLSDTDTALLTSFFYQEAKATIEEATISANLNDPNITTSTNVNPQAISSTATAYIKRALSDANVVVNPGYGTWNGAGLVSGSGSLSAPVSSAATSILPAANGQTDPTNLPPSQVCG